MLLTTKHTSWVSEWWVHWFREWACNICQWLLLLPSLDSHVTLAVAVGHLLNQMTFFFFSMASPRRFHQTHPSHTVSLQVILFTDCCWWLPSSLLALSLSFLTLTCSPRSRVLFFSEVACLSSPATDYHLFNCDIRLKSTSNGFSDDTWNEAWTFTGCGWVKSTHTYR